MEFDWYLVAVIIASTVGAVRVVLHRWGPYDTRQWAEKQEGEFEAECHELMGDSGDWEIRELYLEGKARKEKQLR